MAKLTCQVLGCGRPFEHFHRTAVNGRQVPVYGCPLHGHIVRQDAGPPAAPKPEPAPKPAPKPAPPAALRFEPALKPAPKKESQGAKSDWSAESAATPAAKE
jgi:hypothetical protein